MSVQSASLITLIGMPGSGKSTVGKRLADYLHYSFVDTDSLLVEHLGQSLQSYLEQAGYLALREQEASVVLSADFPEKSVIATGGSVVYSASSMARLKALGPVIFLSADVQTLMSRVSNFSNRGLACPPGTDFQHLFDERVVLYQQYADVFLNVCGLSPEAVVKEIVNLLLTRHMTPSC